MIAFADNANLYVPLSAAYADKPERTLLTLADGQRYSFADLDALSAQMAGALRALGVGHDDRVAVQVDKSPAALALVFAIWRTGAVLVPLNTAYTDAELEHFVKDARPRVLIVDPARQTGAAALENLGSTRLVTLDGQGDGTLKTIWITQPVRFPCEPRAADDLAAICYTSGTTGKPKGALLSHGNLTANAATLRTLWGFTSRDVLLHVLPIYHVHGLFVAINTLMLAGGTFYWLPRFDLDQVVQALPRVSAMMGVPTYYTRLLEDARFTRDLVNSVRLFISGSAPLQVQTFAGFEARTGQRILERYGMSETGMLTSNPLEGARKPGTVGPPLPDVSLRIVNEHGRSCAVGETGAIEVRGPNVFGGYWQLPETTAEAFRADGYFITGDLGCFDADGYVQIVGRAKDLIISGGLNVYPKEIEQVLDDLADIAESAVIGVPHGDLGEAVVAVVVPAAGRSVDEDALRSATRAVLAPYKVPKRVFACESLPRNAMGKVEKAALRRDYAGLFVSQDAERA